MSLDVRPLPTASSAVADAALSADVPTTAPPRRVRRPLAVRLALYVLLALTLTVFVLPLVWLFTSAVKPEHDIYVYPLQWIPTALELANFSDAWTAAPFDRFFLNSLITTVSGTTLEVGLAVLSAYAFAFVRFRWKTPLFLLMLGSMMLPGHVTLLVNYITVGNLGWLNTYLGIVLPGIGSAFAMFLIYQQMRRVSDEVVDAAKLDGAGHLRRMWSVVIPMSRPMILTGTLIVMFAKWNDYVWPLIVTSTVDMRTLPIGLMFLRSQEGYTNWGAIMAGTVMVALPMLLIFFVAQRRIIGGLAAGATKG
ncbi:binding-protein-dependent transport systems inner membrane component [Beutenbergia cavernae DSM 12333]|uniref:Binding-protein-dependent transport systems inner membrane component n=1 Tax=Beutenbergia cavernae (strain ATCC BAA-8 / DSM 12333 / CCUG 43141 / JCM 11478 / NBRC 16432 / NCIMB 13614 / HKI 0122) TaxID=471853 RepID=C5C385_BEUC1|nr:carbohydrate ABC transporter permease [Beutenbergia cavernae]ACQ79784.1 binding-protein-dependent transport systems inner membrane component [Beutenbergia cavernae DSM 12333]